MRRFCTLCLSGSLFLIVSSSLLWASDLFEAPLLDCSGLPCVDVSAVNGRTLRLLIDTGNNNSYLDTQSAQEAGISLSPLQGSNGSAIDQVQRAVLPQVKINGSLLGDVGVMVYDLSDTKKKGQ